MEDMNYYNKHYITVDAENRIVDGFSDAFRQPTEKDVCINEKGGYQFRMTYRTTDIKGETVYRKSEENPSLFDWNGMTPLYKYEDGEVVKRTEEEIEADKIIISLPILRSTKEQEISLACNQAIIAGMDVETSKGLEHFSLQETDQINLTTATNAIQQGLTEYPYHADGQLCRMFTAEEILSIADAATKHKLYHTTLCNHLLTWVRRAETKEELDGIIYSEEILPEDLAANMAYILSLSSL